MLDRGNIGTILDVDNHMLFYAKLDVVSDIKVISLEDQIVINSHNYQNMLLHKLR